MRVVLLGSGRGSNAEAILKAQEAGRLGKAETLYRSILTIDPGHADSLHLMGLIVREAGKSFASAAGEVREAVDFLRYYGRYAMVAAKRKAAGPRQAQSRYEQLGRDLAAAEEEVARLLEDIR